MSGNAVTSVVRFEGRTWVFKADMWVQLKDSIVRLGGFSQNYITESMYRTLERRRFDDMVSGHPLNEWMDY